MKLAGKLSLVLFLAGLTFSPAVLQAVESSPEVSVQYTDSEIELVLSQYIEKVTGWSWTKKTMKSGNEFMMFSFNLGKDFPLKIILDSVTINEDKSTGKRKAKVVKFFVYSPSSKMNVKNKAAALAAFNEWNDQSYFPRTAKIDGDNDIVCDFFIFLDESAPIQAGQAHRMMDKTLHTWVQFTEFLQSKGAIN